MVADRVATIEKWKSWAPKIRDFRKWPLAFAVQDGMSPSDVPPDANVIFVGGTTEWKWRTVRMWCEAFSNVHVARVGSERLLWMAHEAGAESCDSTGWMMGGEDRLKDLEHYLETSTSQARRPQIVMDFIQ